MTPTAYSQSCSSTDIFVTALDPTGTKLLYSQPSQFQHRWHYSHATAIAADATGKPYVAGRTVNQIPTTSNAYQATYPGTGLSVFAMILYTTASGSPSLVYSTLLNTSPPRNAVVSGIAADNFGKFYVTGQTTPGFPVTAGAFQTSHAGCSINGGGNCDDVFVAKLDPTASGAQSLIYSTYIGGTGADGATAIAVDSSGNAYVTGNVFGFNNADIGTFPVTPGAYNTSASGGVFESPS